MRLSTTVALSACLAASLYLSAPAASALPVGSTGDVTKSAKAENGAVEQVRYRRYGHRHAYRRYAYRRHHYRPYYYRPYYSYYGDGYGYPYYYRRRPGIHLYFRF